MTDTLAELAPRELWRHFSRLSEIPRPSGAEQAALDYVKAVAEERGAGWRQDDAGNVVVFVDGEPGPTVAVQAHLDMVCEKDLGVEHDFTKDPIKVMRDGNRVYAQGTTLGADNGIGAAAALALLTSDGVRHGPLELVFTVREETGLHGAMEFNGSLLQSKMLINLDSEDPDELTIGCAGGATVEVRPPLKWTSTPEGWQARELVVTGLTGGHSGVDIDKPRANALKVALSVLSGLRTASEVRLAGISGGTGHNVIPREAAVQIVVSPDSAERLGQAVHGLAQALMSEWAGKEPNLQVGLNEIPAPPKVLEARSEDGLLALLADIPHGPQDWSETFPGKVETSVNLAQVRVSPDEAVIVASARSLSAHKLFRMRTAISTAGLKIGAKAEVTGSYPGWDPEPDAPLLKTAARLYEEVNGKPASIEVIHAGLECGVLVSKKQDMQAISFGPRITGPHSPQETVDVDTVDATWRLLVAILNAVLEEQPPA
ncbi:MAG TPA: beta-Ala-His dipeptidase [Actinomycetota bacterium]|nr:beta-Ala-His dipeptidase [Actinomycetota bacterium]